MVFRTLIIGQRDTKLCPYLVSFAKLYFSLPLSQPSILPLFPRHCSPLSFSASAAAASLSLAPVRYIPACYQHHIPTNSSGVISVPSHRSRIYCVAVNCDTLFCLLQIYSSIASKPLSPPRCIPIIRNSVSAWGSLSTVVPPGPKTPPGPVPFGCWPPRFLRQ